MKASICWIIFIIFVFVIEVVYNGVALLTAIVLTLGGMILATTVMDISKKHELRKMRKEIDEFTESAEEKKEGCEGCSNCQ